MAVNSGALRMLLNYTRNSRFNLQRQFNRCARKQNQNIPGKLCYCHAAKVSQLPFPRTLSTATTSPTELVEATIDSATYERVCSETLDALCDYLEELTENASNLAGSDVTYGDGVLTVKLGRQHGTYVINRQTPNKQIWLSSPTSGPKRYDFVGAKGARSGRWIYKHNGESLHELLQREVQQIFKDQTIDFFQLPYGA